MKRRLFLAGLGALPACRTGARQGQPVASFPPADWHAQGYRGAVTAGGRSAAATEGGLLALRAGGNAADAAATALLALTFVDASDFCFGSEIPIIVRDGRSGAIEVICGVGRAPGLATIDRFARLRPDGTIPADGDPLTALVPGALGAVLTLLERHGTITFASAASPLVQLLDAGREPWHADLARTVRRLIDAERLAGGDRRRGLRHVGDFFYRGPVARELDAWAQANGSLLRYTDLATHATPIEDAVGIDVFGHTVWKCGAWTQGAVLQEALGILDGVDLRALGRNSPAYAHIVVEALKLAFADRDTHLADPAFADVPLHEMLAPAYLKARRALLDPARASREQRPGDPRTTRAQIAMAAREHRPVTTKLHDTTTCIAADAAGTFVVATPSGWGGVMAGSTGVKLGSRLRSLNVWPNHPNALAPGKRPCVTLSPTLVTRAARRPGAPPEPVLAVSVAGGDYQEQVALQVVLNHLVFGLGVREAVSAPRFGTDHLVASFNQPPPVLGSLTANPELGDAFFAALRARGHDVRAVPAPLWQPTAVARDPDTGLLVAAGDPRAIRKAAAL